MIDVNYGGSTGYGREYRQRLNKNWGIVDVQDCCAAAEYLVSKGLADANKLMIKGGSAGGYTTLAVLTFTKLFKVGMSSYGICDLEALWKMTHKFEAKYLTTLIGAFPECKTIYEQRSPINFVDKLDTSIILLQGDQDKVVPPQQSIDMYDALKKKGKKTALLMFEGEQHGFRIAKNVVKANDACYYFAATVLGFGIGENVIEKIDIDNL